ncbi:MAG TPA: CopD family protein [Pseudomonadales bacterium]
MEIAGWELAVVAAKWLVLLATAGAIGAPFILILARHLQFDDLRAVESFLHRCALIGLSANLLWFLLQIGAVNRSGIGGMFDRTLGTIFLQSGVGAAWETRMLGFTGLMLFTLKPTAAKLPTWAQGVLHALAAVLLLAAFDDTGHVSTLPGAAQLALVLHVLAVCLWIGALYPLLQLSRSDDIARIQQLMRRFGEIALGIVAVLLVTGVFLATRLLDAPGELLGTPYGRVLLLKLFGVYALLMFAAMNKLLLVPRLSAQSAALRQLQKSIRAEWIVALLVLAVTGWMTSVVGPAGM